MYARSVIKYNVLKLFRSYIWSSWQNALRCSSFCTWTFPPVLFISFSCFEWVSECQFKCSKVEERTYAALTNGIYSRLNHSSVFKKHWRIVENLQPPRFLWAVDLHAMEWSGCRSTKRFRCWRISMDWKMPFLSFYSNELGNIGSGSSPSLKYYAGKLLRVGSSYDWRWVRVFLDLSQC